MAYISSHYAVQGHSRSPMLGVLSLTVTAIVTAVPEKSHRHC